jgi:hypothetical protein
MNGKITSLGDPWEERRAGEKGDENPTETSGNRVEKTSAVTCADE